MSKHTPGPWQVSGVRVRLGEHSCQAVGPDGFSIAFLPIGRRPDELAGALADARLIAAAPLLLEALKAMTEEWVDYMTINHLGDPWAKHNMKLARAAIAAAEGGDQ